jgi:hypothetical protein
MESKKINQLATELTPSLSDLTIIGDPTTGISKKITLSQMASLFTGTVEEYANVAAFPLVGVADTIYIALDTNVLYRWDTSLTSYVELSPNIINSLVFSDANGFDGNISLVGSVATLTITTALTTGSVPFIGASGALSQDNANLFFDDTNNRLGINTNSPTTALDVFGSGIIGRINGTSTNNAYLGFASAGTNKWSAGNVQSDHRFRIFSEANSAELITILQTGEFGIGIANPLTKLHIDGGATALIANLDANVSVAKTLSFRSDNSNRINLEVSGTESGSNAGANFFIRRYSDAGSLIDTPLTITRSTGVIGVGTTPFLWSGTDIKGIDIGTRGGISTGTTDIAISNNAYYNGSWFYKQTDAASFYQQLSGVHRWFTATSGTAGNAVTFTEKMTLAVNGYLGLGTDSPATKLSIVDNRESFGVLRIQNSNTIGYSSIEVISSANAQVGAIGYANTSATVTPGNMYMYSTGNITFLTGGTTEKIRMTSEGNLGIGTSAPPFKLSVAQDLTMDSDVTSAQFMIGGATTLGKRLIMGYDTNSNGFGFIKCANAGVVWTPLILQPNGGKVLVRTTDAGPNAQFISSGDSNDPFPIGAKAEDASQGLIGFFNNANAVEGSITIASGVVSYNSFMGSHWSQLSDNSKLEILKGTILEAIDELCEWDNETNDRLAKVKISDTIESKNVYGIFLGWDNTDEFNDMYVASLGASFIRIYKDEIVSMGDFLQSNGDGTAKVQSDDIMRSSSIAKVVSTNKIETYEDGSYLIAATLHCG